MLTRFSLLISVFLFPVFVAGQIQLVPLSHNPEIRKETRSQELQAMDLYHQKEFFSIQSGRMEEFCIQTVGFEAPFDTLEIAPGSSIIGGSVEIENTCLTYNAFSVNDPLTDSVELVAFDEEGGSYPILFVIRVLPSLSLPFIETFSAGGPFPDDQKWLDRYVFVNSTLAENPLSIGVATFDGLDERGQPYGGGTGVSDHLSSRYLNLEGASQPVLEYYYQPRGLGFVGYPRERDSLILEFRAEDGDWERMRSYPGIGNEDPPSFSYEQVDIPPSFRYDGFQFRFKNISQRDGILGLWHLDYITVTNTGNPSSSISDIAFTRPPSSVLHPYSALPSTQFSNWVSARTAEDIEISISNNFPSTQEVNTSRLLVEEGGSQTPLINETLLEVPPIVPENQRTLAAGQFVFQNPIKLRDGLINAIQSLGIEDDDSVELVTVYEMEPDNEQNIPEFQGNNRITRTASIEDYYAYDDGTAEVGIFIQGGSQFDMIAQEYEAIVGDTIKGIRMFFPYVFNEGNRQRFELLVWADSLDTEPVYSKIYDQPIFAAEHEDQFGAFTTFGLKTFAGEDTSVYIPPGKFYVGWRQISIGSQFGLYVGFDKNSPAGHSKIFFNKTGQWEDVLGSNIVGSIMIRPVFGPGVQVTTQANRARRSNDQWVLYPNPADEVVRLKSESPEKIEEVRIHDLEGRVLQSAPWSGAIEIGALLPGTYFLSLWDEKGQSLGVKKFIKNR